jgi:crotonobetainyl-CoA:carnitine CoA-transferase CaiB-like acyl-CoA transferase
MKMLLNAARRFSHSRAAGPLSHLRVLDLSRVVAGPTATQTLADMGAEVIKVERLKHGDDTRGWGPPFVPDAQGARTVSAYFLTANRSKMSLALDISTPRGQDIVRELAKKSDVLVENFKLGGLAKYGLGYADLKEIHPGLVYCSITGFGQSGPLASRAGYDFLVQAMGGLMSVTGEKDGTPGAGPQKVGVAVTDLLTGLYTTIGALSGLARKDRTGEGCHVDCSILDVTVASMADQALSYLVSGIVPKRMGNDHSMIVPWSAFATADHSIIIAVGNDGQFARMAEVIGRAELGADERYATNAARVANRDELMPALQDALSRESSEHWIRVFEAAGVPCGPVQDMRQVFEHPQVVARGMRLDLPHPTAAEGTVPGVACPIRLVGEELPAPTAPPQLGEHTDRVLKDVLGMPESVICELRDGKVIG